ncbi:MAG: hypothetical protein ACK6DY_26335 [Acidobacteriota bacterium]
MFLFQVVWRRRPEFSAAVSGALVGVTWSVGHHEAPVFATTVYLAAWAGVGQS